MKNPTVPVPTRVLVFGLVRRDGSLHAEELLPVAASCAIGPEQLRSCLRRLVADGLFVREGQGRSARYAATQEGLAVLRASDERLRLAYRQDAGAAPWDGAWHLVAFQVPERRRAARDAFREGLRRLGGAAVQGGLYVSANPWEDAVRGLAKRLGVVGDAAIFSSEDLDVAGVSDPGLLARRLWPLAEVGAAYERFLREFEGVPATLEAVRDRQDRLPDSSFLPGALAMAARFADCFDADPLLPVELWPGDWPGGRARELLLTSRRQALALREAQGRPALFHSFDDLTRGADA